MQFTSLSRFVDPGRGYSSPVPVKLFFCIIVQIFSAKSCFPRTDLNIIHVFPPNADYAANIDLNFGYFKILWPSECDQPLI